MSPVNEVAAAFLRLGTTAFGGPAAHLAMMEEEFVRRREWLTHDEFLDLIGAANLVPGPNSTEVAIHIGMRRAGVLGMIAAGVCFILPAALSILLFPATAGAAKTTFAYTGTEQTYTVPAGVTLGQIIVDGHNVDALAFERV